MFDTLTDSFFLRFLMAAFSVAIALGVFFGAVQYLRRTRPGTFLGNARPRQARLQVLDQVAVDARRRLVLIRRDNVEHLLLIGGPQDLVIEQDMGKLALPAPAPASAMREADFADAAEEDIWHDAGPDNLDYPEEVDDDFFEEERPVLEKPKKAGLLGRLRMGKLAIRRPSADEDDQPFEPEHNEPRISARFAEWEEDDDDLSGASPGPAGKVQIPMQTVRDRELAEIEDESVRLRGEPPTGTIRPLSGKFTDRAVTMPSAPPPEPQLTPEEAAIARELEAARRRAQIPAPNAALRDGMATSQAQANMPRDPVQTGQAARPLPHAAAPEPSVPFAPQQIGPSDFDRVLEREMQEKLEAARRPVPQATPVIQVARVLQEQQPQAVVQPQQARPVTQQPRRDMPLQRVAVQQLGSAAMQSGIAQIFGEEAANQQRQ